VNEQQNGRPEKPKGTERPFRSAFLFYGGLALFGFAFLLLTGQNAQKAAIGAGAAFVLATSWTWWRMWRDAKRAAKQEGSGGP
jgi:threonine/homoserine/homoserine lactone efflux protein